MPVPAKNHQPPSSPRSVLLIGLGYVGLPVAAYANATDKYEVTGFDLDESKIAAIKNVTVSWVDEPVKKLLTKHPLSVTSKESDLNQYDLAVIAVPTPVNQQQLPNLTAVKSATQTAAKHLKKDGLLILESTVNPGVCDEVLRPLLAANKINRSDILLAHCPERIDPGNPDFPLPLIPRVLGAQNKVALTTALDFYRSFISAPLKTASSLQAAEASKIVENAFRDINIAFVNELAQSFAHFDNLDVVEVINAAATKPFGFMPHYPGAGVGGHCIPVDPYYLINSAKMKGFEHSFLSLARQINRGMPAYTVELVKKQLVELGLKPSQVSVNLLGLSYKAGIADLRNSPALEIRSLLESEFTKVTVYDPLVSEGSTVSSLAASLKNAQVVVLATAHPEFVEALENKTWPNLKLIVDGRNCLNKEALPASVRYIGIGR